MTKVCCTCGRELREGFFSSDVVVCGGCHRYFCKRCIRETGDKDYCPKCFEEHRD